MTGSVLMINLSSYTSLQGLQTVCLKDYLNLIQVININALMSNLKCLPQRSVEIPTFNSRVNIKWICEQDRWWLAFVKKIASTIEVITQQQNASFSVYTDMLETIILVPDFWITAHISSCSAIEINHNQINKVKQNYYWSPV